MHRNTVARLIAGAALLAGALTAISGSAGSADGPRPGLPERPEANAQWIRLVQGGATEAKKAKQWARVPMQVTTVANRTVSVVPPPPGLTDRKRATNYLFLMSEDGYGRTAPFKVHTAAFGSIPAVATLRIAQRRDPQGLPIPLVVRNFSDYYITNPPEWPDWADNTGLFLHDTDVTEQVNVLVESLTVDGVDLGLRAGCKTAKPATLDLLGKGWIGGDPTVDEEFPWNTGHFAPASGGLLSGTTDVPAFANCITHSGEDVSGLLTAAISGTGNSVTLHANSPFSPCTPAALPEVGEYDANKICPEYIPGIVGLPPQQP